MHKLIDIQAGTMLLVDKPKGWTSFDVVNKIRWAIRSAFNVKKVKVGHAGTLDPAATGLLIVCVGKMTKQIDRFQGLTKEYTGTLCLGATTPSYDSESEIDQRFPIDQITDEKIVTASKKFLGEIMQKPPIFSALKKDGVRLYKLARKNIEVEISARPVQIDRFDIKQIKMPNVDFEVVCSKGTYIRSLAFDMGAVLESGAYLTALRRTAIGSHLVKDAWQLDDLIPKINALAHEHSP